MENDHLLRHFARIGALLNVSIRPAIRRFWATKDIDFLIDVIQAPRGEAFHLTVDEEALPNLEVRAVDVQPKQRHPDHKTVGLPFWHQVAINDERTASTVAFLD